MGNAKAFLKQLPKPPRPVYTYAFDLGNSSEGPIGAVIRVIAHSPEEALERLRRAGQSVLAESFSVPGADTARSVEYAQVYLETQNITLEHISETEDYSGEDPGGGTSYEPPV